MVNILKKIADWIVAHEEKDAENCTVPDEVIDEWLETIEERKKRMEEHGRAHSEQYEMLLDLEKKVMQIKEARSKKMSRRFKVKGLLMKRHHSRCLFHRFFGAGEEMWGISNFSLKRFTFSSDFDQASTKSAKHFLRNAE
jgi:hypothetical protein